MASVVSKKRGKRTYYYLVESARVDGKPRIVSQEYLGTAEKLAVAMRLRDLFDTDPSLFDACSASNRDHRS